MIRHLDEAKVTKPICEGNGAYFDALFVPDYFTLTYLTHIYFTYIYIYAYFTNKMR